MEGLKNCKNCESELVIKQTKRTSEQLKKSFYYTAYYFCPQCRKLYHDEKFKVTNNSSLTDLMSSPTRPEIHHIDSRSSSQSFRADGLRGNDKGYDAHIWTDGACSGNGTDNARAAWAFVSGEVEQAERVIGKQTNNTAEALAVYHALLWAAEEKHKKVRIYTDSQITLHGLAKSSYKVKANREIFHLIEEVISANGLTVDYEKVPAHADNIGNNRADKLANTLAGIPSLRTQ